MSPRHSLIQSSIGRVLVLPVLALLAGEPANAQGPTVHPRLVAATELSFPEPVWETAVAVGPQRAVAVFNVGNSWQGTTVRVGYAIYDLALDDWIEQGIIPPVGGSQSAYADGSVQWYDTTAIDGGDEGESEDSGGIPVRGFVAAGLVDTRGVVVSHLGASSTIFAPWRIVSPPPHGGIDRPWLAKGNTSGSELYIVYMRGTTTAAYLRSRDFGASWYPQAPGDDVIRVGKDPVEVDVRLPAYAAAVEDGNLYIAYNRPDGKIGLLEGVDRADGGVVFDYLRDAAGQILTIARQRFYDQFAKALPCITWVRLGGQISDPHIAVAPGSPTTLYVVYQDTVLPESKDVDVYLSKVVKQGGAWSWPTRVRVNTEVLGRDDDQWLPTLTVDPNGRIHVVYYDDRRYTQMDHQGECHNDPDHRPNIDVFYAYSDNGAERFETDSELCLKTNGTDCEGDDAEDRPALRLRRLSPHYHHGEYIGIRSYKNRTLAVFNGSQRQEGPNDRTVIWGTRIDF